MTLRAMLSLLLMSLLTVVRAAAAEPVVFVVDAQPQTGKAAGAGGSLGILGAVVGNMAQRAVDRKAAAVAAELYPMLSFDVLMRLSPRCRSRRRSVRVPRTLSPYEPPTRQPLCRPLANAAQCVME